MKHCHRQNGTHPNGMRMDKGTNILVLTDLFPNSRNPMAGIFYAQLLKRLVVWALA